MFVEFANQWAKLPKNSLKECVFVNSKYTLADCFFGDFAHWVTSMLRQHSRS